MSARTVSGHSEGFVGQVLTLGWRWSWALFVGGGFSGWD